MMPATRDRREPPPRRTARILLSTPVLRHPPQGGPSLRIDNAIKALSRVADLYLHVRVHFEDVGGHAALSFYKRYCRDVYFAPSRRPHSRPVDLATRATRRLVRQLTGRAVFTRRHDDASDFDSVIACADRVRADIIWLGYGNLSYRVLAHLKRRSTYRVVVDSDSVWSRYVLRGLPFARTQEARERIDAEGQAKQAEERWGTRIADITTAVSAVDAEYYRGLAERPEQVHIFSNGVDVADYRATPPPPPAFAKPCLYLAGTFSPESPMDDGARWVIREVLPLVRRALPDVHFYIVGSGSRDTLKDVHDPEITVTGTVASVLPYLCHADVALVPLRFESGTRIKILEAGACGIPVVSTSLGAEGLDVTGGVDLLLADEPGAFASAIVRLLKDPEFARETGARLRTLVVKRYGIDSLAEQARLILRHLGLYAAAPSNER